MKKKELLRKIRYQLNSEDYPGTKIILDLINLLIDHGGVSLGDITNIKDTILKDDDV
jgi:hypothetical protein